MKNKDIYLDGAANTPLDRRVLKAMKPFLSPKHVGNSYAVHDFGVKNMLAIEEARSDIASVLKCNSNEVFFTSGATESNNWVIKTVALHELFCSEKPRLHIICGATEHSSVLNTCKMVEKWGLKVSYVHGTGHGGSVLAKDVKRLLTPETCLICIMAINNETGVSNEADEAAKLAKKNKTLSLIDCTQWMSCGGKDMELVKCFPHGDFFSFSAHKIYGPTGVGCLVARRDVQNHLDSFVTGGAQESGLRGGTSNTAGIVGMAAAMKLMYKENLYNYFTGLLRYLVSELVTKEKMCKLNASPAHCNIASLNFGEHFHTDNLAAVFATFGIAVSAGSACDTTHQETLGEFNPSHVLKDLKLTDNEIKNTIRVSFTKYTTKKDLDALILAAHHIYEN